jgi:hypothetical protein
MDLHTIISSLSLQTHGYPKTPHSIPLLVHPRYHRQQIMQEHINAVRITQTTLYTWWPSHPGHGRGLKPRLCSPSPQLILHKHLMSFLHVPLSKPSSLHGTLQMPRSTHIALLHVLLHSVSHPSDPIYSASNSNQEINKKELSLVHPELKMSGAIGGVLTGWKEKHHHQPEADGRPVGLGVPCCHIDELGVWCLFPNLSDGWLYG